MNILIVDDELPARERLALMVSDLSSDQWQLSGTVENGQQAIEFCEKNPVDIVFMDIRMPVMDGLETAALLAKHESPPAVVFTTAYSEYALEAFDAEGVAYLLKPIKKKRLEESLKRISKLKNIQAPLNEDEHLSGNFRGGVQRIAVKDVIYFFAEQKYVNAVTQDREVLLDDSLIALEEKYANDFVRIHRNALVAKSRIIAWEKNQEGKAVIVLEGIDHKLEISRRHLIEIRKLMKS